MKKILAILLAGAMGLTMAACGSPAPSSSTPTPSAAAPSAAAPESKADAAAPAPSAAAPSAAAPASGDTAEIAMITDLGTIDDKSFNQGTWDGVKKFAEANGKTHKYYKPTEGSDDAYLSAIELAVKGGAKVVVTPGFLFQTPIFKAQTAYPDVTFILIDGNPQDEKKVVKIEKNAIGIIYAEEQAGFLAGYAAVKEGMTKLGFLGGMAVPAVVRYGYGYVQGAEAAAKEMGLPDASISVNYHYTGGFDATPEAQTLCASWYQNGTQVIFGCGGAVGNSAMAAALAANGKVIGVDNDQSAQSPTIITSAMKYLAESVNTLLGQYYAGTFPGGQSLLYTASEDMLGLPMATSKFEKFTQADYDAIYAKLKADTDKIASGIVKNADASGKEIAVTEIPLSKVKIEVIK